MYDFPIPQRPADDALSDYPVLSLKPMLRCNRLVWGLVWLAFFAEVWAIGLASSSHSVIVGFAEQGRAASRWALAVDGRAKRPAI